MTMRADLLTKPSRRTVFLTTDELELHEVIPTTVNEEGRFPPITRDRIGAPSVGRVRALLHVLTEVGANPTGDLDAVQSV